MQIASVEAWRRKRWRWWRWRFAYSLGAREMRGRHYYHLTGYEYSDGSEGRLRRARRGRPALFTRPAWRLVVEVAESGPYQEEYPEWRIQMWWANIIARSRRARYRNIHRPRYLWRRPHHLQQKRRG